MHKAPKNAEHKMPKVSLGRARSVAAKHNPLARHAAQVQKCAPGQQCDVFGVCGGCDLLHVPYAKQLEQKQREIEQLFGGVCASDTFGTIIGAGPEGVTHYRDKVIAPFVPGRKIPGKPGAREVLTGMYSRGTHRVIPSKCCMLESAVAQDVVRAIMQIVKRFDIEPYNEDTGRGFLRHAVVRVGHESGEVLVTLVTNSREFPHSKNFCRELVRRVPQVTSVVQNINTRQTNVVLGDEERTLFGPGFILDTLAGLSFRISSQSFYQVHRTQTAALYAAAIDMCALDGTQVVLDAYCGTGTIGLVAAARGAAHVVGVDSVEAAIHDARLNARHNGIENAQYFAEDATTFMRSVYAGERQLVEGAKGAKGLTSKARKGAEGVTGASSLVIVMDPPRAGSTPQFIAAACALEPERVVYVSCNPKSQLRDVEAFARAGYTLAAVQPVDMFPHTPHTENICLLVPKK
jgi:23S rRNA (uracil1939-C5)-methyltransferase